MQFAWINRSKIFIWCQLWFFLEKNYHVLDSMNRQTILSDCRSFFRVCVTTGSSDEADTVATSNGLEFEFQQSVTLYNFINFSLYCYPKHGKKHGSFWCIMDACKIPDKTWKTHRASIENFFTKHPRIMHKFSKTSNNSTNLYKLKNFGKTSKNFTKCSKNFTKFHKKNPNGNSNFHILLTNKYSIDFFEKKSIYKNW